VDAARTYLSSKERVENTILRAPVDHVPCAVTGICHGGSGFLDIHFNNAFEEADFFIDLGLDTAVHLPPGPDISAKNIGIRQFDESFDNRLIHSKEYTTRAGTLRQSVFADRAGRRYVPLFSDEHVPRAVSLKYLVGAEPDLAPFRELMKAPDKDELRDEYDFAKQARAYSASRGVPLAGGLTGIGDPLLWLSGVENILYAAYDTPDFLRAYIKILSDWNIAKINTYIDMGADFILRRGWYESADFWSPRLYRDFLLGPLKKEVDLAHAAGLRYIYIMNSGVAPLVGEIAESGIDILSNAEPEKNDLAFIKAKLNKAALCTGVNNYHILENGAEPDVEAAVVTAMQTLAPGGGFILSPSDSINFANVAAAGSAALCPNTRAVTKNFYKMVDTWKSLA